MAANMPTQSPSQPRNDCHIDLVLAPTEAAAAKLGIVVDILKQANRATQNK